MARLSTLARVRYIVSFLCALLFAGSTLADINFTDAGRTELDAFAQSFNGELRFQDFNIVFVDTGDGVLDFEEIVYFSGVDTVLAPLTTYTDIRYVPDITGLANSSGSLSPGSTCPECWEFLPPTGVDPADSWDQGYWSYELGSFNSALLLDDLVNFTSTPLTGGPGNQTYGAEIELFLQNANLTVDVGSVLTAGSLATPDTGIVNLEGAGSSLVLIGDRPRILLTGQGSALNISNGAVFDATAVCPSGNCDLFFGQEAGDSISIAVDGNGSLLNTVGAMEFGFIDTDNFDALYAGSSSSVDLTLSNGAAINSADVNLGVGLIGTSIQAGQLVDVNASVTGSGTTWNATTLNVGLGNRADANLSINGGGAVIVDALNTGVQAGSVGNVQVDFGSLLQVNGDANIGGAGLADMRVRGNSNLDVAGQLTLAQGDSPNTTMFVESGAQVTAQELSIASETGNNAFAELILRNGGQLIIDSGGASTLASVGDGDGATARLQATGPGSSIDIVGGASGATLAIGSDVRGVVGTGLGIFGLGFEATASVRGSVDGNNNVIVGDGREGQLSVTNDASMDINGSLFVGVGGVGSAGAATGGQLTISGSVATASTGRIGVDVGVAALDGSPSQGNFSATSAGTQVLVQSTDAAVQAYIDVGLTSVAGRAGTATAFGRISVNDGAQLILDSVGNTALVTVGQGQGGDGEINLSGVDSLLRITGTGAVLQLAGSGSYGAIGDGEGILRVGGGARLELAGSDPTSTGLNIGLGAGTGSVLVSDGGTIDVNGALILGTPAASGAPTAGPRSGLTILSGGSVNALDTLIGADGTLFGEEGASLSTNSLTVEPGGVLNFGGDLSVADLVLDSAFYLNEADFNLDDTNLPVTFSASNSTRVEVRGNMLIGAAGADTSVAVSGLGSLLSVGGVGTGFSVGSDGGTGAFTLAGGALGTFDGTLFGTVIDQTVLSIGEGGTGSFDVLSGARFTMQDSLPGAVGNAVRIGIAGANDPGVGNMLVDGIQTAFTHTNANAILEVGVADTTYAGNTSADGTLGLANSAFMRIAATVGDGELVIGRGAGAVGTVNVASGASLTVEGADGGRLLIGTDEGTLSGSGGSGTLNIDNSFVSVFGLTAGAGEAFIGQGAGTGTLNMTNGGNLFVDGGLFIAADNPATGNAGVASSVFVDEFSFLGANTIEVGGNGQLQSAGTLQGQLSFEEGSELTLSGTHFGDITNQGGRLSLGGDATPGQLTVIGDYTQQQGTLFLSLHGFDPGTFDQLNVLGNVDLAGGAVELDFLDGFSPDEANGLPVITASGTLNIDPDLAYNVGAGVPAFQLSPLEILVLDPDTGQQVPQQLALINFLNVDLTTLIETLGFTPNEIELVNSIEQTCAGVAAAGGLNQDQLDFLNVCADVRNAGNTPEQILQTVKALDTEEVTQLVNSILLFTIPQHGNLSQRINALRSGADPFDLSALNLRVGDQQIAGADLDRFVKGLLGGAAGASDGFAKWGVFGNGNFNFGDRDATENADGYDFETISVTLGVDYRARDNLVFGGSLSYSDVNADFDEGGGMNLKSWAASVFGTYFVKDKYYLDVMATYGQNDIDSTRNITFSTAVNSYDRRAYADTDGDQFSISLGTGYDFTPGAWVFGPHGGMNYTEIDADSYTERGANGLNLTVARQTATSFTANLGAHVSYTFTPNWGVLIPYVRADWVHEFESDAEITEVNFNVTQFTNDPDNPSIPFEVKTDRRDANYLVFSAGISAQFVQGISGFLNYRTTSKLLNIDTTDVTFGLRFERNW